MVAEAIERVKTTTLTLSDNCPKCGTKTLELDPEGDVHCWACGRTYGKPQKKDRLLERHQFYEKNKVAILKDVQSIGAKATAKKWKVNGVSLHHVLQRWEREKAQKPAAEDTVVSENGRLPSLPEFSNTWEAPVQLKWLEVYEKLLDSRM